MGLRFRKSFRLAPGIKINLAKTGPSLSLGERGAMLNIGHGRKKATIGIPGTGLSYQRQFGYGRGGWLTLFLLLLLGVIILWVMQR